MSALLHAYAQSYIHARVQQLHGLIKYCMHVPTPACFCSSNLQAYSHICTEKCSVCTSTFVHSSLYPPRPCILLHLCAPSCTILHKLLHSCANVWQPLCKGATYMWRGILFRSLNDELMETPPATLWKMNWGRGSRLTMSRINCKIGAQSRMNVNLLIYQTAAIAWMLCLLVANISASE